jgi:hypothetical protein
MQSVHAHFAQIVVCTFCRTFQTKASKNLAIEHDAHAGHTGRVQIVRQLYDRLHGLHLHVGALLALRMLPPNDVWLWLEYTYRTAHPVVRWLPTKLAEWIGENLQDDLGFPD